MRNGMKIRLLAGEPALGVSVMIPSPQVVEMVGGLGFDWVLLDCEHGTIGLESLELMIMAADACGITPVVRPATKAPHHIMAVLDRGAAGVQVPHVVTEDDARAVVEAVKFHPLGQRGLAADTRAARYGYRGDLDTFLREANEATLVCVQIEDDEALDNAERIAAVPGVDVVFIGPSDLSQSMGYPSRPEAPEVREAIDDVIAAALGAGKVAGLPAASDALAETLERGVRYTYTHLPKLLAAGAKAHHDRRPQTSSVVAFPR